MQRSERPVRMASNSATVMVRMWPSPCPEASKLSRKYRSCRPGKITVAGVKNRRRIRTNASVSLVLRSLAMRLTGMSGWSIPMANGSRDGLLEQIPAVLGDSECHPGRQVALRRWEGWRSTQSASANQCQDQSKRH